MTSRKLVAIAALDPVGVGLVASVARPGGNVTGTSTLAADVVGKQLEVLKELLPRASRVARSGTRRTPCSRSASWARPRRPPRS